MNRPAVIDRATLPNAVEPLQDMVLEMAAQLDGLRAQFDAQLESLRHQLLSPTRADFRVRDRVSFDDRHLQTRVGTIVRISQRTATLDCDGESWRVSFPLLRHLVDL